MRGLKPGKRKRKDRWRRSHLLQMRGLKLLDELEEIGDKSRIFYRCVDWNILREAVEQYREVASFTDAWIETVGTYTTLQIKQGRIFYRCVDWNWRYGFAEERKIWSHLLQMRGLKHCSIRLMPFSFSRIFYRCVDWNISPERISGNLNVASFTDAWIETSFLQTH